MTDRPAPWPGAFNLLEDLAAEGRSAADYAMAVRKLYDLMLEETGDPEAVREFLSFRVSAQQNAGLISQQHRDRVAQLLPPAPRRGRGRPKGALGNNAYDKRHQLYLDWTRESTLNPSLTKEQFAKSRLRITDAELAGPHELDHRAEIDALLQDLKPARMRQLDEGQRRAIEILYPLTIEYPQNLARRWRDAKQQCPSLTEKQFLQDYFGWPRGRKRHPIETEMINEHLEKLVEGEKLLAGSERR